MNKKPKIVVTQIQALRADVTALKYTLSRLKIEVRKIEELRATITKCNSTIKQYESSMKRREAHAFKNAKRMTQIEKDYISLFKMQGTTITFFEKRNKKGDWISGEIGGSQEIRRDD